jgi:hypothetical protein
MCPVSRGAFYGIRVPRLKKRTTSTTLLVRGAAVHVCVRYAWFCFWEPQPDIGARRGTVRSRRASRSGIAELGPRRPKPVRNAFIFDHIASTHPSPARSHTSGTGIHPMEKPQCRREKPRPSYSPQSGGLDETHLQLHQYRIKLQGKHDLRCTPRFKFNDHVRL